MRLSVEDRRTLGDYGITKALAQRGIYMTLVLRLRGGMYQETSGRLDNDQYSRVCGKDMTHTDLEAGPDCLLIVHLCTLVASSSLA